ncbi:MAG: MgtC/SapB family protein [Lentisphaeria bacterium]
MEMTTFLLRIGTALFLGAVIGFERDVHGRAAGLRTHMLVSVGSALFTLISISLSTELGMLGDPGRIAAQIVSGIGFLGAGTILKSGFNVRGLTTAACMWLMAAIGMACAVGWLWQATIVSVGMLLVLLTAKKIENKLHRVFTLKVSIGSGSGDIFTRMFDFLNGRKDITITSTDGSLDVSSGLYTTSFMIDTMTSRGQMAITQEIYKGIVGFEKELRFLKIECIS